MKVLATIQLLATLFTAATAAVESVRGGARQLTAKKVTTFPRFKLTGANEISPFVGVPSAFGLGQVTLDFDPTRSSDSKWKVCIKTTILGYIPGLLHIHKGKISENGGVVADFSSMLKKDPFFDGCVAISQSTYDDIRLNTHLFYVNAHVAGEPTALFNRALRGQILQKFRTSVVPSEEVSPFKGKSGASGEATISFESAGKSICIDATITGFNPALGHLHKGNAGSNGDVVVDFSSKKVAPGRYLGCVSINVSLAVNILASAENFYFNFHLGKPGTDDFNVAIRGQL